MLQMIALKRCGRHQPGSLFSAQPTHAKALIALGRAEIKTKVLIAENEPEGYLTKIIEPPLKRGRGRPRIRPLIEEGPQSGPEHPRNDELAD